MHNRPLVSIIVPVFNMGQFLNRAIDSFLSQSEGNFEIIICDNNSTDDTGEIVAQYKDRRIRYFRNDSNIGMVSNWNTGLKLAKGKYITLISCDEFMVSENSLKKRLDLLESTKEIDLVWCDYNLETIAGETVTFKMKYPHKNILTAAEGIRSVYEDVYCTGFRITTVIFRRQILESSNYTIPLVHSGDRQAVLFWMLLSRNVAFVPEVLHCSYMHTEHRHDFFGKKSPYIGERDYLTLKFLDEHAPRLIAMGLSIDKLEFLNLKQLGILWLKMPTYDFSNFYFYGCYFWYRLSNLLIRRMTAFVFIPIYWVLKSIYSSWFQLRRSLARIPFLKRIYKSIKTVN